MPRHYSGPVQNYHNVEHFQETAVKTINELFGREKPYDVFDFSEDKAAGTYSAVAYYDDEDMPAEQKCGEALSPEAKEALKPQAAPAADAKEPEEGDALPEVHVAIDAFLEQVIGKVPAKRGLISKLLNKAPAKDKANGKKRIN